MVENSARCSDKNVKNSSKISMDRPMDRLIKVDEKTSVSDIIHVM